MPVQVAINGFGRTGRAFLRSAIERDADITVVAINDLADAKTLAQLLKYDSSYGRFPADVSAEEDAIVVDGHEIQVLSLTEARKLPWGRARRRGRDRIDRALPHAGRCGATPAGGRREGDHLGAGAGRGATGRDGRARGELR